MVGNNPIVLVGTKMDLLPVGTSAKEVASWLAEAAARKRLPVMGGGRGRGTEISTSRHLRGLCGSQGSSWVAWLLCCTCNFYPAGSPPCCTGGDVVSVAWVLRTHAVLWCAVLCR